MIIGGVSLLLLVGTWTSILVILVSEQLLTHVFHFVSNFIMNDVVLVAEVAVPKKECSSISIG